MIIRFILLAAAMGTVMTVSATDAGGGTGGTVTLKGRFAAEGSVAEVKIVFSEPKGKFDAAALRSVASWHIKPYWAKSAKQGPEFSKTINFYDDSALRSDPSAQSASVPKVMFELEDDPSWSSILKLRSSGWLRWPNAALAPIRGGWVHVKGAVGIDGKLGELVVVEAHPAGLFDDAVLRAARIWRFERKDDAPITAPVPFTQYFWYDAGATTFEMMQAQYLLARRGDANKLLSDLAALCPDAYPRAADELNAALKGARRKRALPSGPVPDLPESAPEAVELVLQYGECLFSSWEQLKDPKAYSAAARFGWFDQSIYWHARFALCDKAVELGLDERGCRRDDDLEDLDRLTARRWVAAQFAEGYQELIGQRTAQRGDKLVLSKEAQQAMAEARQARAKGLRTEPVAVLTHALRRAKDKDDIAVLRLALARTLIDIGDPQDAQEQLDAILKSDAPWYGIQMARVLSLVTGENHPWLGDRTERLRNDFEANVATLNAELGTADRLTF